MQPINKTVQPATQAGQAAPGNALLSVILRGRPGAIVLSAIGIVTLIALADWRIESNIPLGFLYLFPMLLAGSVLNRWQIALFAAGCTFLTEEFDAYDWASPAGVPRDILVFSAFFGMGLFVYEIVRNRRTEQLHLEQMEREVTARGEAEEQLKILVESSPAAVFTADSGGVILLANEAAHRLFGVPPGTLAGASILNFLPSLANVRAPDETRAAVRTAMQCRGRRQSGEIFLADAWFSTYRTSAGPRLAAMVVDASEELRSREETSLHQLLAGSRLLVGAVSHEIRNVCGAIAMAHTNLARSGELAGNHDFEALGKLIAALERIAAMDLRKMTDQASPVDLPALLDEFSIIVGPSLAEDEIALHLAVERDLPAVWADRQSLLQVFLNLTRNSQRAMQDRPQRELTLRAFRADNLIVVRFSDTGGGVEHPERLFHPFQRQAQETGLGLYLSRAFMRSFRGDLRYEKETDGAGFIVELTPAHQPPNQDSYANDHQDSARGRSQSVPREPQPAA